VPFWTPSQRRGLVVLLVIGVVALGIRYATNRRYVPDPEPAQGPRYAELADKIDPNTADRATLAALPMLGEKRAQAIIDHREQYMAAHPGSIAYPTAESLTVVKGIGHAMVDNMKPFLMFPVPRATTKPN
jgi:competence protein ComEA